MTPPPAILTPRARAELRAAICWLDNPAARRDLNDVVEAAALLIGANPAIGARRLQLASGRYRFWLIPRYRYLLAYTDATEPPRIVRIVQRCCDPPRLLAELGD